MMSLCRVDVVNVFLDQNSGSPVVLLQARDSGDVLPILVAPLEASLIAIEIEGKKPVRPLTHDLLASTIHSLSWQVESIVVEDLKDNIFYAKITLEREGERIEIDSRPSDAIALALRTKSPMFVRKKVFGLSMGLDRAAHTYDADTLKEMLENIDIDDVDGKIM
ncbi:MAG: bifunctional nuclease family protein [Spirochaetes bacterium]|nr:bifunctional nuclease family protein [Spirochaetota bacterium]